MSKKLTEKRVSIDIPIEILDKIDVICKKNFISRRKWFIDAASQRLENVDIETIDKIVRNKNSRKNVNRTSTGNSISAAT